jgi:hypothetical protein
MMPSRSTQVSIAAAGTLLAGVAALSLAAGGASAAASCTYGKEHNGCTLKDTGYFASKSGISVTIQKVADQNGMHSVLNVPGSYLCPKGTGVSIVGGNKTSAKVGSTLKFKGKGPVVGVPAVKSFSITGKVAFTSAKKAQILSGSAKITLTNGKTCKHKLSGKLDRALGG